MNNLIRFLLEDFNWNGYAVDERFRFMQTIVNALNTLLWPIMIIVASVGAVYSIFLGINMAKAEEPGKRDEARKRLINTIIAIGVVVVIIVLVQVVINPNLPMWLGAKEFAES